MCCAFDAFPRLLSTTFVTAASAVSIAVSLFLPTPTSRCPRYTASTKTSACHLQVPLPRSGRKVAQLLSNIPNITVQVDLPKWEAMDEWVCLKTQCLSVNRNVSVSEARTQSKNVQVQTQRTQQSQAAIGAQVVSLTAELEQHRWSYRFFSSTHNMLKHHSMEQLQTIASVCNKLITWPSNAQAILRCLCQCDWCIPLILMKS